MAAIRNAPFGQAGDADRGGPTSDHTAESA